MGVSMAGRCSDTKVVMARAARLVVGLSAALATSGALAGADSIRVTPRAALDGSRFGLEVRIDSRAGGPTNDAYVAVGSEKGFRDETALEAGFTLDVSRLSLGRGAGASGVLPFLRFGALPGPGPATVLVFLEQTPAGSWLIGARTWDDDARAWVLAGRAPLPPGPPPVRFLPVPARREGVAPRLEIEWAAASVAAGSEAGHVRMLHVRPDGERVLLFEKTDLDNGSQVVNHVRVGVVADDRGAGASGRLCLDDFEVNRLSPSLP